MAQDPSNAKGTPANLTDLHSFLEAGTNRRVLETCLGTLAKLRCERHELSPPVHFDILRETALLPVCETCVEAKIKQNGWDASQPFDERVCATAVVKADCWACKLEEMEQQKREAVWDRGSSLPDEPVVVLCSCKKDVQLEMQAKSGEIEEGRQCACCGGIVSAMLFTNTYGEIVRFEKLTEKVEGYLPPLPSRSFQEGIYGPLDGGPKIADVVFAPGTEEEPVAGRTSRPGPDQDGTETGEPAPPQDVIDLTAGDTDDEEAAAEERAIRAEMKERRRQVRQFATLIMGAAPQITNEHLLHTFQWNNVYTNPTDWWKVVLRSRQERIHEKAHDDDYAVGPVVSSLRQIEDTNIANSVHASITTDEYVALVRHNDDETDPDLPVRVSRFVTILWEGSVDAKEVGIVLRILLTLTEVARARRAQG